MNEYKYILFIQYTYVMYVYSDLKQEFDRVDSEFEK